MTSPEEKTMKAVAVITAIRAGDEVLAYQLVDELISSAGARDAAFVLGGLASALVGMAGSDGDFILRTLASWNVDGLT